MCMSHRQRLIHLAFDDPVGRQHRVTELVGRSLEKFNSLQKPGLFSPRIRLLFTERVTNVVHYFTFVSLQPIRIH